MMDNKYKELSRNTIVLAIGSFGTKILAFIMTPLYTAYLTTKEYGIVDIISTTSALMIYVLTLNISDSVFRFIMDDERNRNAILKFAIKIVCVGGGVLGIIIYLLHIFLQCNIDKQILFFLWSIFFTSALTGILSNYLQASGKIGTITLVGFVQSFVIFSSNIVLICWFRLGIIGYFSSIIIGGVTVIFIDLYFINQRDGIFKCKESLNRNVKREMLHYSIPLIFNNAAWWINSSLDRYIISIICGYASNGIYSVSSKIATIFTTLVSIFLQAWGISAIREFDSNDNDGFFANTYAIFNSICILLCSGLILINIPISNMLFHEDFFSAWKYSSVLVFSSLFSVLGGFVGVVFSAVKDSRAYMISTIYAAIANAILNIILIKIFGIGGAAVSTLISFIIVWGVRVILAKKYILWRFEIKKHMICYGLISLQIVGEHSDLHAYMLQVGIFILLFILNRREIRRLLNIVVTRFHHR